MEHPTLSMLAQCAAQRVQKSTGDEHSSSPSPPQAWPPPGFQLTQIDALKRCFDPELEVSTLVVTSSEWSFPTWGHWSVTRVEKASCSPKRRASWPSANTFRLARPIHARKTHEPPVPDDEMTFHSMRQELISRIDEEPSSRGRKAKDRLVHIPVALRKEFYSLEVRIKVICHLVREYDLDTAPDFWERLEELYMRTQPPEMS